MKPSREVKRIAGGQEIHGEDEMPRRKWRRAPVATRVEFKPFMLSPPGTPAHQPHKNLIATRLVGMAKPAQAKGPGPSATRESSAAKPVQLPT